MSVKNSRPKMTTISFKIDTAIAEKIKAIAKSRGISMSAYVRECLQDFITKMDNEGFLINKYS
jgi:predicted transcriptional regulator